MFGGWFDQFGIVNDLRRKAVVTLAISGAQVSLCGIPLIPRSYIWLDVTIILYWRTEFNMGMIL